MQYKVRFFKDRQKFSAAHFTIFNDGEVERLHGHNYSVDVTISSSSLDMGLMAPFHDLKAVIGQFCNLWDEYVLLPTKCPWVDILERNDQVELYLKTPKVCKFYSFPKEDVVLLDVDNISCENLTQVFGDNLCQALAALNLPIDAATITIGESSGQTVSMDVTFEAE